jgi:hypothetical protein
MTAIDIEGKKEWEMEVITVVIEQSSYQICPSRREPL